MTEAQVAGQTILVTGGAGFVGSALALGLKARYADARVVALDNLKRRGSELNITRLKQGGVEFVHGDIRNASDLDEVGGVDLLLECSAEPSVLAGYNSSPRYVIDTNLCGMINCLEHARKHGAGVIFLSSSRVYPIHTLNEMAYTEADTRFELSDTQTVAGISAAGISEACPLDGARSMYGASKLCSELVMQEYMAMYDMPGIINRCGVLTGPWQMGKMDQGVVVLWAARHLYGGKLSYIGYGGTGKQVRDILHVQDLLELIVHQIEHLKTLSGGLFNAGGGREVSVSLAELTQLCENYSGNSIEIASVAETRDADIPVYITDNAKVTEVTGWTPKIGPDVIIEEVVDWLREHEAMLRPILAD